MLSGAWTRNFVAFPVVLPGLRNLLVPPHPHSDLRDLTEIYVLALSFLHNCRHSLASRITQNSLLHNSGHEQQPSFLGRIRDSPRWVWLEFAYCQLGIPSTLTRYFTQQPTSRC